MNRNLQSSRILISERLTLRRIVKEDSAAILHLRSDPEINKFLHRKPSKTIGDALDFINSIIENENGELFYWAITKTGDDKLIGTICLFGFSDNLKKCEIGYELLGQYQSQGIMTEAVTKVVAYAAKTLEIEVIDAVTHKENQSSTKLLQRLNFKKMDDIVENNPNLILFRLTI